MNIHQFYNYFLKLIFALSLGVGIASADQLWTCGQVTIPREYAADLKSNKYPLSFILSGPDFEKEIYTQVTMCDNRWATTNTPTISYDKDNDLTFIDGDLNNGTSYIITYSVDSWQLVFTKRVNGKLEYTKPPKLLSCSVKNYTTNINVSASKCPTM